MGCAKLGQFICPFVALDINVSRNPVNGYSVSLTQHVRHDLVLRTVLDPAMANVMMAAFESQWMRTSVLVIFCMQRSTVSLLMASSSTWKIVE